MAIADGGVASGIDVYCQFIRIPDNECLHKESLTNFRDETLKLSN